MRSPKCASCVDRWSLVEVIIFSKRLDSTSHEGGVGRFALNDNAGVDVCDVALTGSSENKIFCAEAPEL